MVDCTCCPYSLTYCVLPVRKIEIHWQVAGDADMEQLKGEKFKDNVVECRDEVHKQDPGLGPCIISLSLHPMLQCLSLIYSSLIHGLVVSMNAH